MIIRAALVLLLATAAFGAGYFLADKPAAPTRATLSCTPSAPHIVASKTEAAVVLFWGNSLLHDHDWRINGAFSVNCAAQGLTAGAAAPMVPSLPEVDADFIVLAFGSVELIRAARSGAFNQSAFAKAVAENIAAIKARWSQARIILTSAPAFTELGGDEQIELANAKALNAALSQIAEEDEDLIYFEMSALYQTGGPALPSAATYDGVHLTREAYTRWQAALNRRLSALR